MEEKKKSVKDFDRDKCTESRIEEGVSIRKEKRAARLGRRRDLGVGTGGANTSNIQIDESFLLLLKQQNVSEAVRVACQNIAAGNPPETIGKGLDQLLCLVNRNATTHPLDVAFRIIPAEETCKRMVQLMATFDEAFMPYVLKICNVFLEIVTQYNQEVMPFQAKWDQVMFNTGFFDNAVKHITGNSSASGGAVSERLLHTVLVFMDLHPMNAQKLLERYKVQQWITKTSPDFMAWYLYIVMRKKGPVFPYENIMTKDLWDFWIHVLKTYPEASPVFQDALCAANHCVRRPQVAKSLIAAVPFERWMELFSKAATTFLQSTDPMVSTEVLPSLEQVICMLAAAAEEDAKDAVRIMDSCARLFYRLAPQFGTEDYVTRCLMHIFFAYCSISAIESKQFVQNEFLSKMVVDRLAADNIHRQNQDVVDTMLGIVYVSLQHIAKSVAEANSDTTYNMFFGTSTLVSAMLTQLNSMNPERMILALRVLSTALSWERFLGHRFIHNQIADDDKWDMIDNLSLTHDNEELQLAAHEVMQARANDFRDDADMDLSE